MSLELRGTLPRRALCTGADGLRTVGCGVLGLGLYGFRVFKRLGFIKVCKGS